jgi:hypothetical protein
MMRLFLQVSVSENMKDCYKIVLTIFRYSMQMLKLSFVLTRVLENKLDAAFCLDLLSETRLNHLVNNLLLGLCLLHHIGVGTALLTTQFSTLLYGN